MEFILQMVIMFGMEVSSRSHDTRITFLSSWDGEGIIEGLNTEGFGEILKFAAQEW
jgi:hypothetical protein